MVAFTKPRTRTKRFQARTCRDGITHVFVYETTIQRARETLSQIDRDAADPTHPLDRWTAQELGHAIRKAVVKAWLLQGLRSFRK